jgi:hypothetical protein
MQKSREGHKLALCFIFCRPCISLQSLGNNQIDALFCVFIYFVSLHVSRVTALIIRRWNCINTASGMICLCKWLLGMPVRRELQNRLIIPDDVLIQFDLLMMSAVTLVTCRYMKWINTHKKCVKLVISNKFGLVCSYQDCTLARAWNESCTAVQISPSSTRCLVWRIAVSGTWTPSLCCS